MDSSRILISTEVEFGFDIDALVAEAGAMEALEAYEAMASILTPPPPSRCTTHRRADKRKTRFAEEPNEHWERWPVSGPETTTFIPVPSTPSPPSVLPSQTTLSPNTLNTPNSTSRRQHHARPEGGEMFWEAEAEDVDEI